MSDKKTQNNMKNADDIKDALKPQPLKRPLDRAVMGGDVAALNGLLGLLNNPAITGAVVPKGEKVNANVMLDKTGATMLPSDPAVAATPEQLERVSKQIAPPPPVIPATPRNTAKIFYTGLIGVGKDYIAEQTGAKIFGFADPLYHLAEYFFGIVVNSKKGKDIPGVRQFLQMAGQWGRAEVSEQYPLTPARACFISMIRSLGEAQRFDSRYEIEWSKFGSDMHLLVNGVVKRASAYLEATPQGKVASTNVRFQPEFKALSGLGWSHYHVMCSPATRQSRVKVLSDKDTSEALAAALNNDVMKRISAQPRGTKLRVIWNDTTPPPSPRLYTVPEFLQEIAIAAVPEQNAVVTGE